MPKIILSQRYTDNRTGKEKTLIDVQGERVLVQGHSPKWLKLKEFVENYSISMTKSLQQAMMIPEQKTA